MHSFDGGNRLTCGLERGNIVLHYCFNSGMQAKCIGKWGDVWNFGWSLFHKAIPVFNSDSSISQTKENVSEMHLVWVITSLTHDLGESESLVKLEVGSSSLIREV